MNPRPKRRRAREVAMQVLYQFDQQKGCCETAAFDFVAEELHDEDLIGFAKHLIDGVRAHREEIDITLGQVASNWSVDRMAPVDRNILRIAIYEIQFDLATPPNVAINEAIEIAKRFSAANSSRFINGILDRVAIRHRLKSTSEPPPLFETQSDDQAEVEDAFHQSDPTSDGGEGGTDGADN